MVKTMFKATLTFECFVMGNDKADAYDKVTTIDAKKVLKASKLKKCEIEDHHYDILDN